MPEQTGQLIYFLSNTTEEEKIKTTLEISEGLHPMSSNDKIYTSYIKEFGPATAFILYGDAQVVWTETIEDVNSTIFTAHFFLLNGISDSGKTHLSGSQQVHTPAVWNNSKTLLYTRCNTVPCPFWKPHYTQPTP